MKVNKQTKLYFINIVLRVFFNIKLIILYKMLKKQPKLGFE